MRPEKFGAPAGLDLTENEKLIFDILEKNQSMKLADLKSEAGLSNKQWDKVIKGLTKQNLAKVTKTENDLLVDLV